MLHLYSCVEIGNLNLRIGIKCIEQDLCDETRCTWNQNFRIGMSRLLSKVVYGNETNLSLELVSQNNVYNSICYDIYMFMPRQGKSNTHF